MKRRKTKICSKKRTKKGLWKRKLCYIRKVLVHWDFFQKKREKYIYITKAAALGSWRLCSACIILLYSTSKCTNIETYVCIQWVSDLLTAPERQKFPDIWYFIQTYLSIYINMLIRKWIHIWILFVTSLQSNILVIHRSSLVIRQNFQMMEIRIVRPWPTGTDHTPLLSPYTPSCVIKFVRL